ncbi:MAG: type II toxin-antitoxin system HicA family toxin [Candidatus Omnitrophica bacterium]|nr:type II toxin-antitoxin system HicA family toxin [Candidatus Omnitrophota bacterium]MBU4140457.1 type II toxin-antitoxin system HicA family toxin [Candidatus Omnitrophota bacterium]
MTRLPRITGKKLVAALKRDAFICKRIEGSHHILQKTFSDEKVTIPVPVHSGKIIKPGLFKHIMRKARLSPEEFSKLLH